MPLHRLAWTLGAAAGLVAPLGCVPAELRLAEGDEAGHDATVDAPTDGRTADRGAVDVDASKDGVAGDSPIEDSATHDSGVADAGTTFPCGDLAACTAPTAACCASTTAVDFDADTATTTYSCANGTCPHGDTPISCDEASQCPGGVCCGKLNLDDTGYIQVECRTSCGGDASPLFVVFCNPLANPDICTPLGKTCVESKLLPGFHICGT
jgi:hypothetical protein